jgi:hypothetical protein
VVIQLVAGVLITERTRCNIRDYVVHTSHSSPSGRKKPGIRSVLNGMNMKPSHMKRVFSRNKIPIPDGKKVFITLRS